MSSPEEEAPPTLSRESTFFSLSSGNSVYFTANDMSSGDGSDARLLKSDSLNGNEAASEASSSTLEEADSITTYSDAGDFSNGSEHLKRSPSTTSVEVKKGISRLCSRIANLDSGDTKKKEAIEEALNQNDLYELRKLAVSSGGLLSNGLRELGWSLLLGIPPEELTKTRGTSFKGDYPDVTDQVQNLVGLDVARVLKRFPPGLSDPQQDHLQSVLSTLICSVLQRNPGAYYYQGFHDISLTFLLVASVESNPYLAYLCLNKMIETNLGPHMEKTMESTHELIHTIYAIIEKKNYQLFRKIAVDAKCPVAFCLPWVLTWFSHTLPDDSDVFRLYDFILGSQQKVNPPHLIPIFVSAALVLRNSRQIMQDTSLTDIATMHQALAKLPSELDSLEPWLSESSQLMAEFSGKEGHLVARGKKIKQMQEDMWNDDGNNNRRRVPARRNGNIFIYVSRLIFVDHRWTTLSMVVLLTALYFQSRLRRPFFQIELLRNTVDNYAPAPVRRFLNFFLAEEPEET